MENSSMDRYKFYVMIYYLNAAKKSKRKARRALDLIRSMGGGKKLAPKIKREIRTVCKEEVLLLTATNHLLAEEDA